MRGKTLGIGALVVALCGASTAAAEGFKSVAYLESWNTASTDANPVTAGLEAIMKSLYVRQLRSSYDVLKSCVGASCTRQRVLDDLRSLTQQYQVVDLYLATHGGDGSFAVEDGSITAEEIQALRGQAGWEQRHRLRAVIQMNCWGDTLSDSWLDLGFDVAVGAKKVNMVGWAYVPLFMCLWKREACFGFDWEIGEHKLRTVSQAINLAWGSTSWAGWLIDALDDVLGGALSHGHPKSSKPVLTGDGGIKITSFGTRVYNQCGERDDVDGIDDVAAYGYLELRPEDAGDSWQPKCCLPGEVCDEVIHGCGGPQAAELPEVGVCPASPAPAPVECRTGEDCPAGLCVLGSSGGSRCAWSCESDDDCKIGERCAQTSNFEGAIKGRYCAASLTPEDLGCVCERMLADNCGLDAAAQLFELPDSDPFVQQAEQVTTETTQQDSTVLVALGEPINYWAVCGCPVDSRYVLGACGVGKPPRRGGRGGCSVGGGASADGGLWALLGLLGLALGRARRRRSSR